jgi:hypothetical protein
MNAGDFDALRRVFAPDAQIWGVAGAGSVEEVMPIWRDLHHGLNMHLDVEAIVAEGNQVGVRYTETGRWTGPFLGFGKPTGRSYTLVAMEWLELADGRIARRWGARDAASQARQVGFPEPAKRPMSGRIEAA